ncbi:ATP-binding cassette transporter [Cyathus striatus]|nr:ATP-binding cassette transporter [Cyathus striatus]
MASSMTGHAQVPLHPLFTLLKPPKEVIWTNSLLIPFYATLASVVILLIHLILSSGPVQKLFTRIFSRASSPHESESGTDTNTATSSQSLASDVDRHIKLHGGKTIFAFRMVRFLSCLVLLGFSITSAIIDDTADEHHHSMPAFLSSWTKKHKRSGQRGPALSSGEWVDLALCLTYLYALLLALVSVASKPRWSKVAIRHLNVLLLATLVVYFYRNIFPFATFNKVSLDRSEGWLLWGKVVALFFGAVVVPLFIPRQYVPVDPKNPMDIPNPEQTAPLFSLAVYSFLDPIVFLAYRVPHLAYDQLPPLADYDYARNLVARSFPHLDTFSGASRRHIFFGIMRVFRREYIMLGLMLTIQVFSSFASPLGINRLLKYLETGGAGTTIRPWLWILSLFLGPTVSSVTWQWYIFVATGTMVRTEGIITQLIFEHSLRIRMKAETTSELSDTVRSTVSEATTPDSVSLSENQGDGSTSEEDTLHSHGATESTIVQAGSSSIKSASDDGKPQSSPKSHSSASNLVGKINNLATTDLGNIVDSRDFLLVVLYIPLQITLCIIFLYAILGWSAFVGLAVILILFPAPGYVAKLVQDVQVQRMKKTDGRVETVTETMNVLRMVKLFGWESKMNEKISDKRQEELLWIWRRQMLDLANGVLNFIIPICTVVMKRELSASIVFSSMSVFDMLRDQLHMVFFFVGQAVTGKVSLDRISDFLRNTELLDSFSKKDTLDPFMYESLPNNSEIGFRDATFVWSSDADGTLTPSKRKFLLKVDGEILFTHGAINLIVGPTGCGKTSLLMALLGEMHYIPAGPHSWFNLPRYGGVAYAAQESWVQNETIKENILFGSPFDEGRYNKVIYQCCLDRDLELFEAGDRTEVGEKGLTLSGGQKARITLARAVYPKHRFFFLMMFWLHWSNVHTAKWIVEKCFAGDLIKGRTVLLVTHNVAMARPVASFIVSMGSDGRILSHGSLAETVKQDKLLARELEQDQAVIDKAGQEIDDSAASKVVPPKVDGKLIVAEEIEEGHVGWEALRMYFAGLGGNHPVVFFIAFVLGLAIAEIFGAIQTWYLGYWASQYTDHSASEVPVLYYLGVYGALLLGSSIIYSVSYTVYMFGAIRASKTIHQQLIESVLGTTLRWLDTTPISRVITRCTQDIRAVDGPISSGLWYLSGMTMTMMVKFGAVISMTPVFVFPGILVAALGGWCGQIYIAAQLSVKREMSNVKAPVLGHFGAAIAGLTSIRAYGAQQQFIKESLNRIDRYTRAARTFYNLNRWICIRIDAMGGLFAASLAIYLVYFQNHTASNTGFSLNMAIGFSGMILWWVRVLNDFEVQGNSLERIKGYIDIEKELKPSMSGIPPAFWPSSGKVEVKSLSARYSLDGPKVLHDLTFNIRSGERIGVVGRTGSGKSSLTLSLLRCIFTDGDVYYDGINTKSLNLDALRSNITIIPQVPELLSGTLRQNLDPFQQHDDAVLNDALRSAGLFALQTDMDEGKITLDTAISSGGGNLSVGQRQILALARAIVRGSKLLILDEATSAIDHKTDSVIQSSLRNELGSDVTIITIAHRLHTIMDSDKIIVLDAGRIVEYDSPKQLLQRNDGKLRALVEESGDKETLYAMAANSQ